MSYRAIIGYSALDGSFSGWHCEACDFAFEVKGLTPPLQCPKCNEAIELSKGSLLFLEAHKEEMEYENRRNGQLQ